MIKAFLLFALAASSLSTPQNQNYNAPKPFGNKGSFSNQFNRHDSGEKFGGFDSGERFPGGGFRSQGGQRSRGSSERFGGFSGEAHVGGFAPRPVGGFEVREDLSGAHGIGGGFAGGSGTSGGFAGGSRTSGGFAGGSRTSGGFAGGSRTSGGFAGGSRTSGGFGGYSGEAKGPVVAILRDDRQGPINGEYSFAFETEDGLQRQESGSPGPNGATVQQGSWSFTYPDGTPADFRFVADENGYQVESNLLPTPPPLPAHAIAQIEKAARERADGIIHDGQYREEDHFGGGGGGDFAHQAGRFSPGPVPAPVPHPASGPGPFRASGRPLGSPQGFHGSFDDSSHEHSSSFKGGNRFQSSFEDDHFSAAQPQHFGGGLQSKPIGVPLTAANQRFGSRRTFQDSRPTYN